MKKVIHLTILTSLLFCFIVKGQETPNDGNAAPLGGISAGASRLANTPINLYTGIPDISFPIYSYSGKNGLGLDISLRYMGGGVKVNDAPSSTGRGWYLSASGAIMRTVRGMPDDFPQNGYLNSSANPSDYKANGSKYYYDSLDAEQDIFQFNFNGRAGKFFIGKNGQIVLVPLSKLRIKYDLTASGITSFTVTTEDGIKYVFNDKETTVFYPESIGFVSGYADQPYTTSWNLSKIISPFDKDTITFKYTVKADTALVNFPQTLFVFPAANHLLDSLFSPNAYVFNEYKKITSISFPDRKQVRFIYSPHYRYDGVDSALDAILICDSIFRYGYKFDWRVNAYSNAITVLDRLIPFTSTEAGKGYQFGYNNPIFNSHTHPNIGSRRDYWGFYNGASNSSSIPTVTGIYTGANRLPDSVNVLASALSSVTNPKGGITYYLWEPNDVVQYNVSSQTVSANAFTTAQNTVSLTQVLNNVCTFRFSFDSLVSHAGSAPFSGSCNLTCSIKSLDGATVFSDTTISLFKIFEIGIVPWTVNLLNGSYLLETSISPGSSTSQSVNVVISWQNQVLAGNKMLSAGIRIKQIAHYDPFTGSTDTISTFRYVKPDGKSSGFLGPVPIYHYPYKIIWVNGGNSSFRNYIAISSEPVKEVSYTQGSPVGYSRVELTHGSLQRNKGKDVYEFTNLQDANINSIAPSFPYAPVSQRDWVMGLPKRILSYDNLGRLLKTTSNTYSISIIPYSDASFLSVKLGKVSITYYGTYAIHPPASTPRVLELTGQQYFPESGRSDLIYVTDTIFHLNGSYQVSQKSMQYDTNFNIIKVINPYNKTKGLTLEQRFYYPYNYSVSGAVGTLRDSSVVNALIATETWITGDANPRLVEASVTDFLQLPTGQIRPATSYVLQSKSPVPQSTIGVFNPSLLIRNNNFIKPQQYFTTYDIKGNLLEAKNALTGKSGSVILDYFNQFPIAQVSNAKNSDVAYTSFESDGSGNWTIGSVARDYTSAITGKKSYNLSNGIVSKAGLSVSQMYLLSIWVKAGAAVAINGITATNAIAQQNGWSLFSVSLSSISSVTISGTGLIDELRLYPKDANMITSTYEPSVGITTTADANNTISYFYYDYLNRLKLVKDKDQNVIKKYDYSDLSIRINMLPSWSPTGQLICQSAPSHDQYREERDVNFYSPTFMSTGYVFNAYDCVTCNPPVCGTDPAVKRINCTCETGTRNNVSTVRKKVYNPVTGLWDIWKWECTYYYSWSDGSTSAMYTEYNDTACPVLL